MMPLWVCAGSSSLFKVESLELSAEISAKTAKHIKRLISGH